MTNDQLTALAREMLPAVRNYLDVTWQDEEGDEKLVGIVARGILYINRLAGEDFEFFDGQIIQSKGLELLLDYCRYARADALDEFECNYLHELNSFQIDCEVARMNG